MQTKADYIREAERIASRISKDNKRLCDLIAKVCEEASYGRSSFDIPSTEVYSTLGSERLDIVEVRRGLYGPELCGEEGEDNYCEPTQLTLRSKVDLLKAVAGEIEPIGSH